MRRNDIVERLNVGIHRLATEVHNLAASATQRYSPLIPRGRFPIRGDDGRAGQIPAVREIVVDKWLRQELVHPFSIFLTPNRGHVGD